MKYLLDTCVISEVIKQKPHNKVLAWLQNQNETNLYLSVLTFGEIEKGIEKSANTERKKRLRLWVEEDLKQRFENRILPIDMQTAIKRGEIQGKSEAIGELIAITGLVNNRIVVTRNTSDIQQSSVELYNPWKNGA